MVILNLHLSDEEEYIVSLFKAKNRLSSKEKAVKEIIMLSEEKKVNNQINNFLQEEDSNNRGNAAER